MANTISVNVVADTRGISKGIGNVNNQLGGLGKSVGRIGGLMKNAFVGAAAVMVGGGLVAGMKGVVLAGSDMNETLSKSDAIFGANAKAISSWADGAAKSMGLSKQAALDGATTFGNFFEQIGLTDGEVKKMSTSLVKASVDLGSFHNAAPVDVMNAMSAATRGEYDSLQKYIPTINAATVEQKAYAGMTKEGIKALTEADKTKLKAKAVHDIVMGGMGKANGDFAKTQDSLANQTKIAKAELDNMKVVVGTALLPVFTRMAQWFTNEGIPALRSFGDFFQTTLLPKIKEFGTFLSGTVVPALQNFGKFLAENRAILEPLGVAILAIVAAIKIWAVVTKAYIAVQTLLNIVMTANPIGILVLAIVGLIAAFVYLWKTNDGFRQNVIKAWNAIKAAASSVFSWLKSFISGAFEFIKNAFLKYTPLGIIINHWGQIKSTVTNAVNNVKSAVSNAWNSVKSATTNAWNSVKTSIANVWNGIKSATQTGISNVVSYVSGIKGKITGIFSGAASWLYNAGVNILQGLLRGIENMIGKVKAKLNQVTNLIPDWKGPAPVDKKLLFGAGQLIMGGLINGIDSQKKALKTELRSVSSIIKGTNMGTTSGATVAFAGGGMARGNTTYEINVTSLDPTTASRAVIEAIREHERMNGAGWRT